MKRQAYYLRFEPTANVNYFHLLALYDLAEYTKENKAFDTIRYVSIKQLAADTGVSVSTMNRILSSSDYRKFFDVDTTERIITLKSSFPKGAKAAFVKLTAAEVCFLRDQKKDNLLAQYFLYMKYYCGFSKTGKTDFTAQQFLIACGYSVKSKTNFDRLSKYNCLLEEKKFIKIEKYRDELGHTRNKYSFL